MNCQRVRDQIKAYLDGELGLMERWRVARHLDACAACQKERIAMEDLTQKVSESGHKPAPEDLRGRVMSKLNMKAAPDAAQGPRASHLFEKLLVSALVLIVAVAALTPVIRNARHSAGTTFARVYYNGDAPSAKERPALPATPAEDKQNAPTVGTPLLIIKTAEVSIEVTRFQTAYDRAVAIARAAGGYVTNSSAQKADSLGAYGTVTMRVPVHSFERTLERLGQLGKVKSRTVTGEDVTVQVVDIESRLRNKRAEERQYLEIMNRANRIADIVTVSNELSRVRGEIEEAQGRLKYLKSAAAMSTIDVELNEKGTKTPSAEPSLGKTFSDAGRSLLGTLKAVARAVIWLLVYVPFWGIPIVLWLVFRRRTAA